MSPRPYVIRYPETRASADMPVADRLRLKADVTPNGCWLYKGALSYGGYAQMTFGGRRHRVHRLSYETFVGPIPDGLEIDHLCRVRHCFNPDHLEPVTARENIRRGWARRLAERVPEPEPAPRPTPLEVIDVDFGELAVSS